MFEIAADFVAVYEQQPKMQSLGTLDELYNKMQQTRAAMPNHVWAWLGLFYTYYSINGQTSLPLPLNSERHPDVKLRTVRDFFTQTPLDRHGKW